MTILIVLDEIPPVESVVLIVNGYVPDTREVAFVTVILPVVELIVEPLGKVPAVILAALIPPSGSVTVASTSLVLYKTTYLGELTV